MARCGNPGSRKGLGRLPFSSFAPLRAFLQGIAEAHEGGGRDAEVRSLGWGMGVCYPVIHRVPNRVAQVAREGLACIQPSLGPKQLPRCSQSQSKDPSSSRWGVSRGLSYLQPTALQPWPAVLAITVPSQGSGRHSPGGKVST